MSQRPKYPHIGWIVPALAVLIGGVVLRSNLKSQLALCSTTLGRLEQHFTKSTACSTATLWNDVATVMLWVGGVLAFLILVGAVLRALEPQQTA